MHSLAFVTPGPTDWIVILVIVLVLFGAKRIPELFRGLGQGMNEFRKAREEFDRELHGGAASDAKAKQPEQPVQPAQTVTYAQPVQPAPQTQPVQGAPPVQVQAGPVAQPVQPPNEAEKHA